MSALYNLEPQPTAKVLLETTAGDILLELFAKQTPLASRNFLQLCLDGYYDNTIFHRLVPGFVIQGGDPTGTGSGGESSFDGEPFADEFHSRLKFNRRGLLGMANTGKSDDNGSQFFLTLGKTEELQGRNTMFGRVVGDTIYNLMKMGEADLVDEESERPLYPTKITGTQILVNPFEDVVPRIRTARSATEEKKAVKKPKRKAGKALLSFGGDEGEEADLAPVVKKPKFNPKLVSAGQEDAAVLDGAPMPAVAETKSQRAPKKHVSISPSPPPPPPPPKTSILAPSTERKVPSRSPSPSSSPEPPEVTKVSSLLDRTNAQIAELKASMKRTVTSAPEKAHKKTALEAMIPATSTRGRKRRPGGHNGTSREEQRTLDLLGAFKARLDRIPAASATAPSNSASVLPDAKAEGDDFKTATATATATAADGDDAEAHLCDLHFIAHCQSCTSWDLRNAAADPDGLDDALADPAWMAHSLTFQKDRLGKDLEWKRRNEEELVVIDPREREREREIVGKGRARVEGGPSKGKGREWDGPRGGRGS
ncbi:hypothetical protein B0A49_01740 [Cryomyces minteri]|uniref:PPIase cyclophilin-type domain-containing protein n=2 Tax=Cryomyces TaxID=329878 RepID=A0A4U0XMP8_9PEZI|nr:hypothetical protein B0A49_01740 [Cryomyces minteri]